MTTAQTGFFNTPALEQLNTTPKKRIFFYDSQYFEDPGPQYAPEEVMRLLARTYPALENGSWTSRTLADGTEEITFVKVAGEKGAVSARVLSAALLDTPPANLALTLETIYDLTADPSFSAADLLGTLPARIEAALHEADQCAFRAARKMARPFLTSRYCQAIANPAANPAPAPLLKTSIAANQRPPMNPPDTPFHRLVIAARRIVTDAACYRLDDGRLAVSPESITALETALAAYDAILQLASVQLIVSDGTTLLLDACLRLPLAQARRLAGNLIAAGQGQGRAASKKNSLPVIHFNRVNGPYGFLSNFARSPLRLDGYIWPSVEHYYQAQKFAGTEHERLIRVAASPALAAQLGRDRTRPLRPDWVEVRGEVMRRALFAKFSQHRRLKEQLLATGSATLVERTRQDAYWGDGGDGHGQNRLGRLLMQARDQLRQEEVAHDHPAES